VAPAELAIGAAARIYPGEDVSGDAWQVDWHDDVCRVAVIDGLGHGPEAAAAANAARAALTGRPDLAPDDSLRLCHAALGGTRGAAISIASLDYRAGRLAYAGVGNVEAHLWQGATQQRLMAYRGIVGAVLPTPRVFTYDLQPDWLLVLHTDGVRSRFQLQGLTAGQSADPQRLADDLLAGWCRSTDDATVVVVRRAVGPGAPALA
jgi:serine phosphatase RsbU (regulator of sigma subunit)